MPPSLPPLRFERQLIADERYESATVFDVDQDGHLDIVSGAYWYPGPNFDHKCPIGPVLTEGEYFDAFGEIPLDVNGDGYLDVVTGGWWSKAIRWNENPKGSRDAQWGVHPIASDRQRRSRQGLRHRRRRCASRSCPTPPAARSGSTSC